MAGGAEPRSPEFDLIVVGGGLAGLTAAREAAHAGLSVVLLEARNRLGGRTFYAKFGNKSYDVGGAWVHWYQPHIWAEINRYGLEVVEMVGALPDAVTVLSSGKAHDLDPDKSYRLASEGYEKFHADAAARFPRPYDPHFGDAWKAVDELSIEDRIKALGMPPLQRDIVAGVLATSCHGLIGQSAYSEMLRWYALSAHSFGGVLDATARFKFAHGTQSLVDAIVADAKPEVVLGAVVETVVQRDGKVYATTEDGATFEGRRMIVTAPMNVLSAIEFTPALDEAKQTASTERHAGQGIKGYFRVAGQAPNLLGIGSEKEPLTMFWADSITDKESIFVMFGPDPGRIDLHSTGAVQKFVDRCGAGIEVVDTLSYDWHLGPFSLGTWCTYRPKQVTQYLDALRKTEGLVHFASADSALGWRGFMDGAIESGVNTGRAVAAALAG